MWSTFQKSNLYVFNEYIILKHLWQVYVTVWAKTHFLDNSSRCERSYRNIMFHFMLCSSFLCYDKAFVLTFDKREPETKGQRMEDYRQFVILKHFTRVYHCTFTAFVPVLWYQGKFPFPLNTGTAQLTTSLVFVHVLVSLQFSILSSVKMWSAWIQKESKWWLNTHLQ